MWQNPHDAYLEERILSADPLELVHVLYQAAMRAVRKARGHVAAREIAQRARSINQAYRVLSELNRSLDHQRGGDLSRQLARVYGYMMRRLIEANRRQSDEPLAEVLGLLATLAEGWDALKSATGPDVPKAGPWLNAPMLEEMTASTHAWSF
jgi:flagellar secretion chaperone FliS